MLFTINNKNENTLEVKELVVRPGNINDMNNPVYIDRVLSTEQYYDSNRKLYLSIKNNFLIYVSIYPNYLDETDATIKELKLTITTNNLSVPLVFAVYKIKYENTSVEYDVTNTSAILNNYKTFMSNYSSYTPETIINVNASNIGEVRTNIDLTFLASTEPFTIILKPIMENEDDSFCFYSLEDNKNMSEVDPICYLNYKLKDNNGRYYSSKFQQHENLGIASVNAMTGKLMFNFNSYVSNYTNIPIEFSLVYGACITTPTMGNITHIYNAKITEKNNHKIITYNDGNSKSYRIISSTDEEVNTYNIKHISEHSSYELALDEGDGTYLFYGTSGNNKALIMYDRQGNKTEYIKVSDDSRLYIKTIQNIKSETINFIWSSKKLTSITSSRGETINFYYSNSLLTAIDYTATNKAILFEYTSNKVTKIIYGYYNNNETYVDTIQLKCANITYDTAGNMTKIENDIGDYMNFLYLETGINMIQLYDAFAKKAYNTIYDYVLDNNRKVIYSTINHNLLSKQYVYFDDEAMFL